MLRKINFLFLVALILLVSLSCKKTCDFPEENLETGAIIHNASVLGFNTGGVKSVHYTEDTNVPILVSFDKGYTYVPVDFSKYTVLNFPVSVGCNTYFEKDVRIEHANFKVIYSLKIESCPDCEDQYRQDNWVLVPAFPANYSVVYTKK